MVPQHQVEGEGGGGEVGEGEIGTWHLINEIPLWQKYKSMNYSLIASNPAVPAFFRLQEEKVERLGTLIT